MNENGYSRGPKDFYLETAAAFVRGSVLQGLAADLPERLVQTPLEDLTETELAEILRLGEEAGLHLKKFKRDYAALPRIHRSLSFLRAVAPESLLDVGSGRGAFLWSCLDAGR